jgi:S1-C subfamily serine protease
MSPNHARLLAAPLLLVILSLSPHRAVAASLDQMERSTVRIICQTDPNSVDTGSGFVVANDRVSYIATNDHVIACAKGNPADLSVLGSDSQQLPVEIVWEDAHKDIAIISAPLTLDRPAVTIADTSGVSAGDPVIAVGFPGAADDLVNTAEVAVPTVTKGNIERIVIDQDNGSRMFQQSAPTNPGNSGGPLFDQQGDIIGINELKSLTNAVTVENGQPTVERVTEGEGIGGAIDIDELIRPMEAQAIPFKMATPADETLIILGGAGLGLVIAAAAILLLLRDRRRRAAPGAPVAQARQAQGSGSRGIVRVIEGSLSGMEVTVTAALVVGRDPKQAQLVFPAGEAKVSRRHCEIRYDSETGLFEVRDCGSTHGTFIAEGSAPPRRLGANVPERLGPGKKLLVGGSANCLLLGLAG